MEGMRCIQCQHVKPLHGVHDGMPVCADCWAESWRNYHELRKRFEAWVKTPEGKNWSARES